MLVAISGSQGSGKSTVLNELEGYGYNVVHRKAARSILDDWGVTLDQVNNDHSLTIRFQDEITKRKWEDESEAIQDSELWFTERTHADLFVYALIDLGRDNIYSDWVNNYYLTCLRYSQSYHMVYYLKGGLFQVEHDDVRGANQHYSKMVDTTMLEYTKQMIHPSRFMVLDMLDLEQRVNIIHSHVDRLTRGLSWNG